MAYVFQGINDQLQQSKSDIFGQETAEETAQKQQPTKTSTEGGPVSEAKTPAAQKSVKASDTATAKPAAFKAGAARVSIPKQFAGAGEVLKQTRSQAESEAKRYLTGQRETGPKLDLTPEFKQDIQKGSEGAFQQVSDFFGKTASPVESFQAQTKLPEQPTITSALRQRAAPTYTAGESAFERALLQQNPDFQMMQSRQRQQHRQLAGDIAKLETDTTQQAKQEAAQRLEQQQGAVRGYLGDYLDDIIAQAQADEQAKEDEYAALDQEAFISAQQAAALENLRGRYGESDPRLLPYLEGAQVDPSQYYIENFDVTPTQMMEPGEISHFNRIQALLGGELLQPGAELLPPRQFNQLGYERDLLGEALGTKQVAFAGANADIERVRGEIEARLAMERDARRARPESFAREMAAPIVERLRGGDYGDLLDPALGRINPMDYVRSSRPATFEEVMTLEDQAALEKAYSVLGKDMPYGPSIMGGRNPLLFSDKDYQQAILDQIERSKEVKIHDDLGKPDIQHSIPNFEGYDYPTRPYGAEDAAVTGTGSLQVETAPDEGVIAPFLEDYWGVTPPGGFEEQEIDPATINPGNLALEGPEDEVLFPGIIGSFEKRQGA